MAVFYNLPCLHAANGQGGEAPPADPLQALAAEVAACQLCGLCESRHRTVPGEGHPQARIVFVGEAPGADEDQSGRPFVGAAGQLLTKIITQGMGLRRDEVFKACYKTSLLQLLVDRGNYSDRATERDARVLSVARDVCVAERVTVDGPSEPLSAPAPAASAVLSSVARRAGPRRRTCGVSADCRRWAFSNSSGRRCPSVPTWRSSDNLTTV